MTSKSSVIVLFTLFLILSCGDDNGINLQSNSIQDAETAYFQMNHKAAYSIYSNIWNDSIIDNEILANAGRSLAKMEWLFYNNTEKAKDILDNLIMNGNEPSEAFRLKARILADENSFDKAINSSLRAIDESKSESEVYNSKLAYFGYVLTKIKQSIHKNHSLSNPDKELLLSANKKLEEMALINVGDVKIAELYLGYSLLLGKGMEAFNGWMSFFRLTDVNQIHKSLLSSPLDFKTALESLDFENPNNLNSDIIVKGLAESGFYEYSELLVFLNYGSAPYEDERIAEIISYQEFLRNTKLITLNFYLETLRGKINKRQFKKDLLKEGNKLWAKLYWEEERPKFSETKFIREIENRFKVIMKFIDANGYYGLHMGHIILDDKRLVRQHGQSTEFRYLSIDHMVSNGYSGWFWDGIAESGGWSNRDNSFLQVRSAYTDGPIESWMLVTDSTMITKTKNDIGELSKVDDSLAKENHYSFLPGLSLRMKFNETNKILDSIKNSGLNGSELKLTFINVVERIVQNASIFAHEGRHSIDKKSGYSRNSEKLEFTAKLSEIYFSDRPKLSFGAIMSRNIGDGTSHGNANLKVIKSLVNWMELNSDKISDFNPSLPTLPQFDKLTDFQLKLAVKSLDPLINK